MKACRLCTGLHRPKVRLRGTPSPPTALKLHRIDWRQVACDPGGIEFTLPTGGWFRLFDRVGFDVIDYQELQAPDAGAGKPFGTSAGWAHRFPSEHVWKVRKRG